MPGQRGTLWWLAGIAVLGFLALYHQPYYPTTWLDEGFSLQGPMNLVRSGQYAMRSSEGLRILDQPLVANGPGLGLPVAVAYRVWGVGLWQARAVAAVFFVLAACALVLAARRLHGSQAACVSLALVLSVPATGFIHYGRQALGLVPSIAYFLLGFLLWLSALETKRWRYVVGAGSFFGLAVVTKGQYWLLFPALALVAILDLTYYRQRIAFRIIVPVTVVAGSVLAAWFLAQYLIVGAENFSAHLEAVRSSSRVTVFAFAPSLIPRNGAYFVRSGFVVLIVPGIAYALWRSRTRSRESVRALLPAVLVCLWVLWFVVASIGWHRYALDPFVIGSLFAGELAVVCARYVRVTMSQGATLANARRGVAALLMVVGLGVAIAHGLAREVSLLLEAPDTRPTEFADFLKRTVPPGVIVESLEWELDVMAPLNYHHPSNEWVDRFTAVLELGQARTVDYHPEAFNAAYVVDGPFSKRTQIYRPFLGRGCCSLIHSIGDYDLYAVNHPGRLGGDGATE